MSRSYKKHPIISGSGSNHKSFAKQQANKRVRRNPVNKNPGAYKKLYNQWDIESYQCRYNFIEFINYWKRNKNWFLENERYWGPAKDPVFRQALIDWDEKVLKSFWRKEYLGK